MATVDLHKCLGKQNEPWMSRVLGAAVVVGALGIAVAADVPRPSLGDKGSFPDLSGAIAWLNSAPLSSDSLRGNVVLVDFWTYTCINSLRPLPYIKNWAAKYKDAGLVVIGVHTPEFSFEHERPNVQNAVRDLKVTYPVAIDSNYRIWQAFKNRYWPAQYLIDGKGRIRYQHFGEDDYGEIERAIQELLKAEGTSGIGGDLVNVSGNGVEAARSMDEQSPETYVGYREAERFASRERVSKNSAKTYSAPINPSLNEWGLSGSWNIGPESAVLQAPFGKVVFRFHSRDLHMVLGPRNDGAPVRFKVTLDGVAPGEDRGTDSNSDGSGEVSAPRLYQLVRQKGRVKDRIFAIEFLDPGAHAVVFTFG